MIDWIGFLHLLMRSCRGFRKFEKFIATRYYSEYEIVPNNEHLLQIYCKSNFVLGTPAMLAPLLANSPCWWKQSISNSR